MAIFICRGFEAGKVFEWCRENCKRTTVLFPAEPFFERCIKRVIREHQHGHDVLAWGDREGLARLRGELRGRNIPCVSFSGEEQKKRQPRRQNKTLTLL